MTIIYQVKVFALKWNQANLSYRSSDMTKSNLSIGYLVSIRESKFIRFLISDHLRK